jgi:hypothetical protein
MKTIFKTLLLTFLLINLSNCSSDNSLQEEDQTTYFIKAKINGEQFESNFPVTLNNLTEPNLISIGGTTEDNTIFIQIFIKNYSGSGTYTAGQGIENENGFLITNPDGSWLADMDGGTGTVTINEDGRKLTGTFSFEAFNFQSNSSITIAEGVFKVLKQI